MGEAQRICATGLEIRACEGEDCCQAVMDTSRLDHFHSGQYMT